MKTPLRSFSLLFAVIVVLAFISGCGSDDPEPRLPSITSFTPALGEAGNVVTITGGNFLAPVIYFNGVKANMTGSPSESSVDVIVPNGVTTGKIRIETSEGFVESDDTFQVIGLPVITSFSPVSGITGDEVTISGQNFTETTKVKFNGNKEAAIISRSEGQLTVLIPENSKPGKITISTAAGSGESMTDFIANPQIITTVVSELNSLPVTITGPGHRLLINGSNFGTTAAENKVKLGTKDVTIVSHLPNQLIVMIPSGVTTGKISLTIGSHTVEFDQVIEVPPGEWKRLDDFPDSRLDGKVFVIGNEAFYGGTPNPITGAAERKDFWKFNPSNNSWSRIADIDGIKYNYAAFAVGNKGYVGGLNSKLWEYSPADDQWVEKATPGFYSGKAVGANGKGYLLVDLNITEFFEYNPAADDWTTKAPFPLSSLYYPAMFVLNDKIYVVGGMTQTSPATFTKALYEYDPATNVWTKKADFPGNGRTFANAFVLNGSGYVGGGYEYGTGLTYEDVWRYDPQLDKWFPSVPHPGYFTNAFAIGDKAYSGLAGGSTIGKNYFYEFTP